MRSFLFGLILGAAGTAGALFYYGYLDLDRAAGEETVVEAVQMEESGELEAVEPAADDMADEALTEEAATDDSITDVTTVEEAMEVATDMAEAAMDDAGDAADDAADMAEGDDE